MKKIAVLMTLTLLAFSAPAQEQQLSMEDRGELDLERSESNHLAGTFRHGGSFARFDSQVTDESRVFTLADEKGNQVVHVEVFREFVNASILNDRLISRSVRTGELIFELQESSPENAEDMEEALVELRENGAYRILPNLAIELVHREIVGHERFPAAQFIHGIAVASAGAQGLRMPLLEPPDERVECQTLKEDPNGDDCYGMCGNECTCWWPVCITCCGCDGCHTHDWSCRILDCDDVDLTRLQRIAHRYGCWTFASFYVPLSPCQRYPNGTYSPPC